MKSNRLGELFDIIEKKNRKMFYCNFCDEFNFHVVDFFFVFRTLCPNRTRMKMNAAADSTAAAIIKQKKKQNM